MLEDSINQAVEQYNGLGLGIQSVVLVLAFGAVFLLMELVMSHSPVSEVFRGLLRGNPKLSDAEVEKCVPMVVTRVVGFIHNSVQVPIALWAITHSDLRSDRFYGIQPLTHYMLCIAGGFFLHDAVSCLIRESPFYIIHGLTCCLGYTLGAAFRVGHFYGGLFLMWEVSTPFVQLRWVLFKMGKTETVLYKLNGLLMVLSFGVARILFGTYFTFLLLSDTWIELRSPKQGSDVPGAIWIGFCAAAATISCLNYYWFSLMLKSLMKIYFKGESWTMTSQDKNE